MGPEESHQPVMVNEVLTALACKSGVKAIYIDCTVGLGGHAEAILNATAPYGKVIGIDRDSAALALAQKRCASFGDRMILRHGSFKGLIEIAETLALSEVAGVLFDLGVSSMQLDSPNRGFSCKATGPLDMRMDPSLPRTAADWVNTLHEKPLADLIDQYGEERASRRIARAIVQYRKANGPITTTDTLADIVCRVIRRKSSWKRIHPATKTFQALRIAVNDELGELDAGLSQAISLLAVGGRLVVISFHSLEDRSVKNCFRATAIASTPHEKPRRFINLYKKPVVPTGEEITRNPRARSAKLRALERVA